jgi:hypothetical protein
MRGHILKASDDIMAELHNPRCAVLGVNDDSAPRWAAVKRLLEMGVVELVVPARKVLTLRPPPGGTERRERMEIRIKRVSQP